MMSYLDFAEALAMAKNEDEAFALFEQAVREFGYYSVDYATGTWGRWPIQSAAEWRIDGFRASFGWESEYAGTEFQKHDRTVPFASRRTTPWLYWNLWAQPAEHEVSRRMEGRVQSIVASGIGIPFHGPGPRFTGAHLGSLLSPQELARLDRQTRPMVAMIAALFHEHYQRRHVAEPELRTLSARERECLRWAACGKTSWETSMILSISESAVKKHLAAAAAKLGALTRTQAVAVALSRGLIHL